MSTSTFISIQTICRHYRLEPSFLQHLEEAGLLQIRRNEDEEVLHEDHLNSVEKVLRLQQELHVADQDLDLVFRLLQKIECLQADVTRLTNRLARYE